MNLKFKIIILQFVTDLKFSNLNKVYFKDFKIRHDFKIKLSELGKKFYITFLFLEPQLLI